MILDGKKLSARLKAEMASRVAEMEERYGRVPALAVIIVGEDPASQTYVRNKVKACEETGIRSIHIALPSGVRERELLDQIKRLNEDPGVDGILVQLPLPPHINEHRVINAIAPAKDVDGFHPRNVAGLWLDEDCAIPCTPKGIMHLINESGINPSGKRAVVVGRSNIVGKPIAKLLLDANATVTIAHSHTEDLARVCREADILVVAVGRPKMIDGSMIKSGAVVIDVGINRISVPTPGGNISRICGDVDFDSACEVASWITPVPGGVGPMTICELMGNTIEAFLRSHQE